MEAKFPKGEIVWVRYYDENGILCHVITSKVTRDYYFLYEVSGGSLKKLGKAKNPTDLENKFVRS